MPALGAEHSKKVAIRLTLGQSNTEAHTKAATEKVPLRGWGKYYIHKLSPDQHCIRTTKWALQSLQTNGGASERQMQHPVILDTECPGSETSWRSNTLSAWALTDLGMSTLAGQQTLPSGQWDLLKTYIHIKTALYTLSHYKITNIQICVL